MKEAGISTGINTGGIRTPSFSASVKTGGSSFGKESIVRPTLTAPTRGGVSLPNATDLLSQTSVHRITPGFLDSDRPRAVSPFEGTTVLWQRPQTKPQTEYTQLKSAAFGKEKSITLPIQYDNQKPSNKPSRETVDRQTYANEHVIFSLGKNTQPTIKIEEQNEKKEPAKEEPYFITDVRPYKKPRTKEIRPSIRILPTTQQKSAFLEQKSQSQSQSAVQEELKKLLEQYLMANIKHGEQVKQAPSLQQIQNKKPEAMQKPNAISKAVLAEAQTDYTQATRVIAAKVALGISPQEAAKPVAKTLQDKFEQQKLKPQQVLPFLQSKDKTLYPEEPQIFFVEDQIANEQRVTEAIKVAENIEEKDKNEKPTGKAVSEEFAKLITPQPTNLKSDILKPFSLLLNDGSLTEFSQKLQEIPEIPSGYHRRNAFRKIARKVPAVQVSQKPINIVKRTDVARVYEYKGYKAPLIDSFDI